VAALFSEDMTFCCLQHAAPHATPLLLTVHQHNRTLHTRPPSDILPRGIPLITACSLFSGVTRGLLQRCSGYLADCLCGGPRTLQDRVAEASWLPCKRPCSDAVRLQVFHAGKVSAAAMQRAYLLVATPEGLRACRRASASPRAPAVPDTGVFRSNADAPARRVRSTPPTQTDTSPHSCSCSCSWFLH
jgi:hypothetical protein